MSVRMTREKRVDIMGQTTYIFNANSESKHRYIPHQE